MKGKVKWYNWRKGYGFITGDDEKDYFVHFSQVPEGTKLYENDEVEFEAVEGEKGMQAQNIKKTGEAPKQEAKEVKEEAEEQPEEDSTEE